jgi:hypothetical protein
MGRGVTLSRLWTWVGSQVKACLECSEIIAWRMSRRNLDLQVPWFSLIS